MYLKEFKALSWTDICTPMFIAASFTLTKRLKQPRLSIDGWIDKRVCCYVYNGMECYSTLKKEGNLVTCYNMDALWGYYVKWSKPVRKRQTVGFHSCEGSKIVKLKQRIKWWFPGAGWWGKWGVVWWLLSFSFAKCNVWEICCTTMWV